MLYKIFFFYLLEGVKEKWAGPLGEKVRGLSSGLLPVLRKNNNKQSRNKYCTINNFSIFSTLIKPKVSQYNRRVGYL